jgi:leucine-zipper of insertion element IS481
MNSSYLAVPRRDGASAGKPPTLARWSANCELLMVVHSVRTEVAEVAKPQCSTERPDARSQECAFDADWSRADCPQVVSGQTAKAVAEAAGVCPHTVLRWVDRYRREGLAGLRDRSFRPRSFTDQPRKRCRARGGSSPDGLYRPTDWQSSCGCRRQQSAASCGGSGSTGSAHWSLPNRCAATSVNVLAR